MQPSPHRKRTLCWEVEQITKSANALPSDEVCAEMIRRVLNQMGIMTHQKGNNAIGDTLGDHGYHLPKYKKRSKPHYTMPPGGLTRALTEEMFIVPPNYAWDVDNTAEFSAAAAAVVARATTKGPKPAKPAPTAPPISATAPAQDAPTIEPEEAALLAERDALLAQPAPEVETPATAPPPSELWTAGQEHTRLNHLACRLDSAARRAEARAAENPDDAVLAARAREKREKAKTAHAQSLLAQDHYLRLVNKKALPPTPEPLPVLPTPIFVADQGIKEGERIEPIDALLDSLAVRDKWAEIDPIDALLDSLVDPDDAWANYDPVISAGARATQLSDEVAYAEGAAQRAEAKAKDHPDDADLGGLALRARDALVAARIQSQAAWTEYHKVYAEYKAAWREGDPPLLRESQGPMTGPATEIAAKDPVLPAPPEAPPAPPPDPVQLARERVEELERKVGEAEAAAHKIDRDPTLGNDKST